MGKEIGDRRKGRGRVKLERKESELRRELWEENWE